MLLDGAAARRTGPSRGCTGSRPASRAARTWPPSPTVPAVGDRRAATRASHARRAWRDGSSRARASTPPRRGAPSGRRTRAQVAAASGRAVRVQPPEEPGDRLLQRWLEPRRARSARDARPAAGPIRWRCRALARIASAYLRSTAGAAPETLDAASPRRASTRGPARGRLDLRAVGGRRRSCRRQLGARSGQPGLAGRSTSCWASRAEAVCPPRAVDDARARCPGRASVRSPPGHRPRLQPLAQRCEELRGERAVERAVVPATCRGRSSAGSRSSRCRARR